jgi:luciferase family oxidoreductase group 1
MLPNHSTLKVAENFKLLEALYPQRIDLGVGRAPGGDRLTAQLLNPSNSFDPQDYIQQISDLQDFLTDNPNYNNIQGKVRAIPQIETVPEMWMLTSSGESAYLAAHSGIALSFAQFINPVGGKDAITIYKQRFKPSAQLKTPKASVGVFAFVSEDEQKAEQVQAVMDYRLLSFEKGRFDEIPTYEIAKQYDYTASEWQRVLFNRQRSIIGTPDVVKEKMIALAAELDVPEIIISSFAESKEDRFHSYELLSKIFAITC